MSVRFPTFGALGPPFSAATGSVAPPLRHKEPIAGPTLNRDATRILTWSDDGTARLWDAATGQALAPLLRHEDAVSSATLNRDETRILTRSWDGMACLWTSPACCVGINQGRVWHAARSRRPGHVLWA